MKFDPEDCRKQAEKFQKVCLRKNMIEFVNKVVKKGNYNEVNGFSGGSEPNVALESKIYAQAIPKFGW